MLRIIYLLFALLIAVSAGDHDNDQKDKNLVSETDDDQLKAESQDVIDHKIYQTINQGQYENGQSSHQGYHPGMNQPHEGALFHPLAMSKPGYLLSNLSPPNQNHKVPNYGALQQAPSNPVYSGHHLPQHNQQEYGPPEGNKGHQYSDYENNLIQGPQQPHQHQQGPVATGPQETQNPQTNENWPLPAPEMPKITHLDVKCEKNLMKVVIEFDRPFNGIIFSKGHYSHQSCVHLAPHSGKNSVFFDISITSCGTTGNTQNGLYGYGAQSGSGTFFENTIVIQYDPQVQEVWDQARKLRCTWHDQYEKSVTFRPFPVDMLDVVRADFAGDNVGCWMQIQVGKGPWASEVAGIVKIGQTMTMVLAIKDEENKFDMLVRNCIAHDGKRAPIELVDSAGCIVRPKLMSKFTKIKNFGSSATVLSYAHFQAFKFPDSMEVHFQCTIQICRYQCPEQCSQSQGPGQENQQQSQDYAAASSLHSIGKPREERDLSRYERSAYKIENTEIGVVKKIQVVSTGDLAFNFAQNDTSYSDRIKYQRSDYICMSTISFASSVIILMCILIVSCILSVFLCFNQRTTEKGRLAEL